MKNRKGNISGKIFVKLALIVSCIVCTVFFVLFHLCIFILICFVLLVEALLPPSDNSIAVSSSSTSNNNNNNNNNEAKGGKEVRNVNTTKKWKNKRQTTECNMENTNELKKVTSCIVKSSR
jgi:Na+-transporting methylmalonyl-CoA/oxaloacetate decarboxylase gamma subunit